MKKQSLHQVSPPSAEKVPTGSGPVDPAETNLAGALDPSEITLVQLDPEITTLLPEPQTASASPEPEASTRAIRIKDLDQAKTADIAPALLPGSKPGPEASPIPVQAQTVLLPPPAPSSASSSGGSLKLWLGLGVCMLIAGGIAAYWFLRPESAGTTSADSTTQSPAVPPELRPYLAQANGGDAKAMHMIALMYWNGLNVRQDRVKGLYWYQKAAAAGDKAAQKELSLINGK